ncbi:MAG: hypothetical protein KDB14_18675 [Planctomycetales bacterium]|nr:hypothetical protein [Planctomycetales bacterium]
MEPNSTEPSAPSDPPGHEPDKPASRASAAGQFGQRQLLWSNVCAWLAAALCALVVGWHAKQLGGASWLLIAAALAIVAANQLAHCGHRAAQGGKGPKEGTNEQAVRDELELAAARLAQREQRLAERLTTFHEWTEFPQPVQLREPPPPTSASERDAAAQLTATRELLELDRRLFELIDEETEALFDRIRDNQYSVDGKLSLELVWKDGLRLVQRVARLYLPDAEAPLLETSAAMILRSTSRASLQMLVVLEQLPLDVKELSIAKLHAYLRTATVFYGYYKAARPYLPWLTNAIYVSRYAFGASPASLGAWYATGALGRQLAKAATERVINQQALRLLQNLVRLLAFEVAQSYGGDFRRRDPNWVYATEVVNLVITLPPASRTLARAMNEVGAIQLRSEYDRVWLYRCLAAGKPASAASTPAALALEPRDRARVATHLERFVESLQPGNDNAVSAWRLAAEQRLGIRLGAATYAGGKAAIEQALRCLGGFLLEVKHRSDDQWIDDLRSTHTCQLAPELLEPLREDPPFLFEYPDLAPHSELANAFMDDLLRLAVQLPGRDAATTLLVEEVGAYLRLKPETLEQQWNEAAQAELKTRLGDRLRGRPDGAFAALALDLTDSMSQVDAIYFPAHMLDAKDEKVAAAIGTDNQTAEQRPAPAEPVGDELIVVVGDGQIAAWSRTDPQPLWCAARSDVRAERQRGLMGSNCLLHAPSQPPLLIEGATWTRFRRYFEILL